MEPSLLIQPMIPFVDSEEPLLATAIRKCKSRVPHEQHVAVNGTPPRVGKEEGTKRELGAR